MPSPQDVFSRYDEFQRTVRLSDDLVLRADAVSGRIVFEGAQGVLLDEDFGFHPHTTWSRCTPANAVGLINEYRLGEYEVVGVARAYTTRHGAGPFVAEANYLYLPESHNGSEGPQGAWRVGHFDGPAIKYATDAASAWGFAGVYVTHVDSAMDEPSLGFCEAYERPDGRPLRILPLPADAFAQREAQTRLLQSARPVLQGYTNHAEQVAAYLDVPLYGVGTGPRTSDGAFMAVR